MQPASLLVADDADRSECLLTSANRQMDVVRKCATCHNTVAKDMIRGSNGYVEA